MTVGVVVVCPPVILEQATEWGRAGLIADSLWISSEQVDSIDPDEPNSITARRIRPHRIDDGVRLAKSLSALGSLDEARIGWIRTPAEDATRPIAELEALLRQLLPEDTYRWFDIVIPQRRTDAELAPLPGRWVRLRVLPEDRATPDVTDAGWDLDLHVPLHASLAAIGILGGVFTQTPWGAAEANRHYEFRAFSRLVLGRTVARSAAERYLAEDLPALAAGEAHPRRYLTVEGAEAEQVLDSAVHHVLAEGDAALSYTPLPPSGFEPPQKVSLLQHLRQMVSVLLTGLLALLGRRMVPEALLPDRFDFTDLGYSVERYSLNLGWGLRIRDYNADDAAAASAARRDLTAEREKLRSRSHPVPPGVWRTVAGTATALVDGAEQVTSWRPPQRENRTVTIPPEVVIPETAAPQTPNPEAPNPQAPAPEVDQSLGVFAEEGSAAATVALATLHARRPAPVTAWVTEEQVSATVSASAEEFARHGAARDAEALNAQLSDYPQATGQVGGQVARGYFERLRGAVAGAAVRADLDADRWMDIAADETLTEAQDWQEHERSFRRRSWLGLGIFAALAAGWWYFAADLLTVLPAWFSVPLGFVILAVFAVAHLVGTFTGLFRAYQSYNERGRRRLEYRQMFYRHSLHAAQEAVRLHSARRVLGRWAVILTGIFPRVENPHEEPEQSTVPERSPKGTAFAQPTYQRRELTLWLADEAAEPGWRHRALAWAARADQGVDAEADAFAELCTDDGFTGGLLARLAEDISHLWRDYERSLRTEIADSLASRLVEDGTRALEIITPEHRAAAIAAGERPAPQLEDFLAEPWPQDDDADRWQRDYRLAGTRGGSGEPRAGAASSGQERIEELVPDVLALTVRLQHRELETFEEVTAPAESSPDAGQDYHPTRGRL
ncbi:hypothetical protein [Nesterenkonia alba]|uniref:hypothetical protein n=1 Tax=Nesterenkonia alba TaxID=515814 RepID=UPI0003B4ED73|nr:hypothetical protein [Nesterenkonia alba]